MALGRFLSSLNLYFPICVLEPQGQVIPRSPSGSDFPRLYLCRVQLPGFPAFPLPPAPCSALCLCFCIGRTPRQGPPPLSTTSGLFCKRLQQSRRATAPVHPQFVQADPASRGSLMTVVLVDRNPSALEVSRRIWPLFSSLTRTGAFPKAELCIYQSD